MSSRQRTWALVLAAGDGTRLATLTTDANGRAVPKQFCSLDGGHSLLDEAVQRGRRIVPRERLCVIVAADHRRFWQPTLWALPSGNVIVQPRNCGTANGILLAVLRILERDPLARIVFLPADHYVSDEFALGRSVRASVSLLARNPRSPVLVGIEPEEADPELGYIVPGSPLGDGAHSVACFVEKPELRLARELLANGALWNSFIFAASGPTLVGMMRERMPELVESMATALARDSRSGGRQDALDELYQELPPVDFSRAVIQGAEDKLRVVKAPACGWSDLGTPKRVADTLKRIEHERFERPRAASRTPSSTFAPAIISLAAQHARLGLAG